MNKGESQISGRKSLYRPILRVGKMASWLNDLVPKYWKRPHLQKNSFKNFLKVVKVRRKFLNRFGWKNGPVMNEGESQISSRKSLYRPILRVGKMASCLDDLAPKYWK
jgi:hypothetical protein